MAFELFRRKQRAFEELMQAAERIKAVVPELTAQELMAFLDGLRDEVLDAYGGDTSENDLHSKPATDAALDRYPPAKAVLMVLREHPKGLKAGEIIELARDIVQTTSDDPVAVIYSAIAHLKRTGRASQDEDKTYKLTDLAIEQIRDFAGLTAHQCCEEILGEHGKPMHALAIAREAIRRGYVGKANGSAESIEATTYKSFWALMSRNPEVFVPTDEPQTYGLKEWP